MPHGFVLAGESKEHLVRLFLVPIMRRIVRLDKVQVEVARRDRSGPLVGCPEEQVAPPRCVTFAPLQFVLPDAVAADVCRVRALQHALERLVVVAVELGLIECFGALLDQGIVIVGLLEVEVVLPVIGVGRDELAAYRPPNLAQYSVDLREQVVRRLAPEVLDSRLVETHAIPEFLRGGAERRMDVLVGQAVDRQSMDDPQCNRPVGRAGERLPDARLQHLAAINHRLDVGVGTECGILAQRAPVGVVRDQDPGCPTGGRGR